MVETENATTIVRNLDLRELFSRGRWQHVIFLTYSFDLPFFEAFLLPMLVQNGSQFITVVADAGWLAERLTIWLERDQIHEAGKKYLLCSVKVAGAFHPKVILGASKSGGTVLVGSGNISSYGMAHGGELFTAVEWHGQQVPSLAREAWELFNSISNSIHIDDRFAQRVGELANAISEMLVPPKQRLLRHNLTEALLTQLRREMPFLPVTDLLLWAPFADRNLGAIRELVCQLQPGHVTIAVQPGVTNIDGVQLMAIAAELSSTQWDFVELIQKAPLENQFIHAKGILITLATGKDILLAGSPNLSTPALLRTVREGNLEVALLIEGRSLRDWLFPDSLISLGKSVDLDKLLWRASTISEQGKSQITLLGASLEGATLTATYSGICPSTLQICLDNSECLIPLTNQNGLLTALKPEGSIPRIVKLIWDGGESNAVIVNQPQRLMEFTRQKATPPSLPLERLISGGDAEWATFLEKLSQLCIIDSYDLVRLTGGLSRLTFEEEAKEAEHPVTPEELSDIDFKAIVLNRVSHSSGASLGALSIYSSPYRIDEVVAYFKMLLDLQQQRLVTPEITPDSDESGFDLPENRLHAVQPLPIGRRIRLLLQHRMRRFINGLRTPAFYQTIPHNQVVKNYVWFLNVIELAWKHSRYANSVIFSADTYGDLCYELLSAFWGNDLEEGYWSSLDERQRIEAGVILIENEADALTMASTSRLLNEIRYRTAPFVIARIDSMANAIGLLNVETAERALVYLEQPERDPATLVQQMKETHKYFSWDRFLQNLCNKHQLRGAKLKGMGFQHGKALVIDSVASFFNCPNALAVFAEWIEACAKQEPNRQVFQMIWGKYADRLIYDAVTMKLIYRNSGTEKSQILSIGKFPFEISSR